MENYQPPFTITNKMLCLVSLISEKIGQMTYTPKLENKPHLRRNNKIKSIHASLKIEANSLSLSQVRDVINGHLVLGKQTEIQEVKNAFEAYDELKKIQPFEIEEIKKYHFIMTKYLVDEAGLFRKGDEGVFKDEQCIFLAPPPQFVPMLMDNLFAWMNQEKNELHPLILSAVFHYEFVFIHPFKDGNGRMARLWHTAILSKWKPIFEYIPIESQIEKFQEEYYDAIALCHTEGKSNRFIEFMLEMIYQVLDEVSGQLEYDQVSESTRKLLSIMEYDESYSSNEIMDRLKIKSKENFRKNYMNPAIKLNLVEMTIPEKPNSRNQKYRKK